MVKRQLQPDAAAGGVTDPVRTTHAQLAEQLAAQRSVGLQARGLGRRRAAPVTGAHQADESEPVQRRFAEHRTEPRAEHPGVREAKHRALAAFLVLEQPHSVLQSIRASLE